MAGRGKWAIGGPKRPAVVTVVLVGGCVVAAMAAPVSAGTHPTRRHATNGLVDSVPAGTTHAGSLPPSSATTTTTSVTPTTTTATSTTPHPAAPVTDGAGAGRQSATGPTCGGRPVLVSDGITWTCTFDSEFTGSSLNPSQWQALTTADSGYTLDDNACYVNSPNNVSVGNGYLSLTARQESAPFMCQDPDGSFVTQYTSGYVTTYQLFDQTYGRFEIMAKVPSATLAGLQTSLWLFPESLYAMGSWPAGGEIDIAEMFSEYPTLAIPYIHYDYDSNTVNPSTDTNIVTNDSCTLVPGQFNDYVLEWTPMTITVTINGEACLVDHWIASAPETAGEPFNQPFFINLTQALGIGGNAFNPLTTPLPATTEIKYVRVWQGTF